jgi:hypothetical protein
VIYELRPIVRIDAQDGEGELANDVLDGLEESIAAARRSAMRSQVPSLDHSRW